MTPKLLGTELSSAIFNANMSILCEKLKKPRQRIELGRKFGFVCPPWHANCAQSLVNCTDRILCGVGVDPLCVLLANLCSTQLL